MVSQKNLSSKVLFKPRMPYTELMQFTQCADAGLSFDKDTNINYRYSLPNKLFDYIQCGIPVMASNLVEVKKIVAHYDIGITIDHLTPLEIAKRMEEMMKNDYKLRMWREHAQHAAAELCWENEQQKLIDIFRSIAN